ncbi:TauD/TfdA dioxygenase family protein, partial [Rhodococcus sp. LB1]
DNVYRHAWREGDLVMWDNRCTMHYAIHGYGTQERVLNRITLRGEVPA